MSSTASKEERAIQMLAAGHLHQCLLLPQTASHDQLRVSFATTGNFSDDTLPTILFVGPMFGTRYAVMLFDKLAREVGVRVICTDRPGLGGATSAPLAQRVNIWLETVPALLKRLNVQHVALMTHSAGAIYTINTLAHFPDILYPGAPYVAFLAPWVHSEHSKQALWNVASKLPAGLFSHWSNVNGFIAQTIMPAASWSGGLVSSFSSLFEATPGVDTSETSYQEKYGVDAETGKLLQDLQMKYAFAEGMTGGNDEAMLCLKKAGVGAWGACEDYKACTRSLAEARQRDAASSQVRLRVRLHFAGSDLMIGNPRESGRKYFEECWRQDGMAEAMDVESSEWSEANHETLLFDFSKGAVKTVLQEIRRIVQ